MAKAESSAGGIVREGTTLFGYPVVIRLEDREAPLPMRIWGGEVRVDLDALLEILKGEVVPADGRKAGSGRGDKVSVTLPAGTKVMNRAEL